MNSYRKDTNNETEIYGYPVSLLPNSRNEFLLFTLYIIGGVVFEELICRQFMFYSFNQVLNLKGDSILILSTVLFSLGHIYQGWKGVISSLVVGLLLGKIFQLSGSLIMPIFLHLVLNSSICILAFKRLREINRI